jgi:hypothetical protein
VISPSTTREAPLREKRAVTFHSARGASAGASVLLRSSSAFTASSHGAGLSKTIVGAVGASKLGHL